MKYADIIDIENYTLTEIDSAYETQVEQWIEGVSRMMDTMTNRILVAPAIGSGEDYETRYYDGNDKQTLIIDDCQDIQSLSIGDYYGESPTSIDESDYVVRPKIAPYRNIILKNDIFSFGSQNIVITGRFGLFNEIPQDIRMACTVFVAGIINNQTKGIQTKRSESIGNYSVSYSDEKQFDDFQNAINVLSNYRKYDF